MRNCLPHSIRSEKDLEAYQEYLNEDCNCSVEESNQIEAETQVILPQPVPAPAAGGSACNMSLIPANNANVPESLKNTAFMPAYLNKHIGKLMKVESLIGGRLETRIGVLFTVGASYIVLKLHDSDCCLICDMDCIRYVTIVHNNCQNFLPLI